MNELDQYECFAIPPHVWSDEDTVAPRIEPQGWTRRNWVYREAAALGAEAMPSPGIDTL
jgi:hypothetical protein